MIQSNSKLTTEDARRFGMISVVFFAAAAAWACLGHGSVLICSIAGSASALLALLVVARPESLIPLFAHIDQQPSAKELRQFGGLCLVFFGGIAAWGWFGYAASWAPVPAVASVVLGLLGAVAPTVLRPVFVGWMAAVSPLGWTISQLLMGGIFFGVITPIGLALRVFGYDPMERKFDLEAKTYWATHEQRPDAKSYFRQF
jgi:hypothetical protein